MPDVLIQTPRGQMPCYLAVPPKPGPTPGVVVLHDVGGMSQDHRNQADWLSQREWCCDNRRRPSSQVTTSSVLLSFGKCAIRSKIFKAGVDGARYVALLEFYSATDVDYRRRVFRFEPLC
jgi:hypothetical protein